MSTTVDIADPKLWQTFLIVFVSLMLLGYIYVERKRLAAISTPYIDALIGRAIYWLVGLVIVTTVATAVLSLVGVTAPIRVLSAESLAYLAVAYAAVSWGRKQ